MAEFVNTQESSSIEVGEVVLKGRYRIFPDQPLPEFDSPSAKAYAAFDSQQSNRSLFCLICDPAVPPRRSLIGRLRGRDSTGMVVPVDEGVCDWPPAQRRVFGVLFGTPGGPRVDPTKAMTGPEILKRVVLPIADALLIAEKRGVTHRGIRVDNLFWNSLKEQAVELGECVSAPPGFDQPLGYEAVDQAESHPAGRSDGSGKDDLYALGVTMLLLACPKAVDRVMAEDVLARKLEHGSYAALTGDHNVPTELAPAIRALLHDDADQRWGAEQLLAWLREERTGPVRGASPVMMPRAFDLGAKSYGTIRYLAYGLQQAKDPAIGAIREGGLGQWLRSTARMEKMADAMDALRAEMDLPAGRGPRAATGIIARASLLLDPKGPLRFGSVAVMPEGLGTLLYTFFAQGRPVSDVAGLLEAQLPAWLPADRAKALPGFHGWIDRMHAHLKQRGLGQGIERCLYEMNPELPCLGECVGAACVLDLATLLRALEANARVADFETSPIDIHVAAFVMARLFEAGASIAELSLDSIQKDKPLFELSLLAAAQKTAGAGPSPLLARWLTHRVAPRLGRLHNRRLRRRLAAAIDKRQQTGDLDAVLQLVADKRMWDDDVRGFAAARLQHTRNDEAIAEIDRTMPASLAEALENGQDLAMALSFSLSLALASIGLVVLRLT